MELGAAIGQQGQQRAHHQAPSGGGGGGPCPEMLQVAEEAFRGGQFALAAEILSSQLAELPQPERSLCLRQGDALARAGRMAEALDSYSAAASLARLRPEELRELTESFALTIRDKELRLPPWRGPGSGCGTGGADLLGDPTCCCPPEPLGCPLCLRLLHEPVTLHCGHTHCKRCAQSGGGECARCAVRRPAPSPSTATQPLACLRVNVVLGSLLEKWFPAESRARRLCAEGDALWERQELAAALEKYNQALELASCKCLVIARRAELCTAMKNYQQALYDAEALCRNKPHWPKGHYVKAQALSGLGRIEEALKEFLYCVALNPEWSSMKMEAQKIMCEMFFPAFENVHDTLTPPFCNRTSYTRLKPAFLSSINALSSGEGGSAAETSKEAILKLTKNLFQEADVYRSTDSPVSHHILDFCFEDNKKTLGTVLSSLPGASLKRKFSSDVGDLQSLEVPSKIPRKDGDATCGNPTFLPLTVMPASLVDASDFECSLCMRLFYEPVTTPCGHTFCLKCLERCLDHNPHCPLCKEKLSEFLASRTYKKTVLTEELIIRYLPEELSERKKVYEEEMKELSNLNKDVPIFVCTMAFPTIPCPLHIFEPRYRLMIRRCMETGTKQFGMCLADELKGFADYGCMLEIRDVKFFPDGRSVVDTVGVRRFRVLSHGQRDGYNTANIEYLEDKKVEGAEYEELVRLHNSVYDQAVAWFTSLKDNMKAQILNHFGSMPGKEPEPQSNPSGPAWYWWLLAVLPLENRAQLAILAMTSLKDRLIAIRRVLIFVTRKRAR
ncbi:LON peptidase N-terminal domain and RING finger protein 2 isoform X2 [Rhineura floridana]|uniref:LON peptidase N-terminal domain and RING finger protein 2 isoform X2 n=1 Tax=Rhineura floridana TaxID=261503 RepID=UPI002AC7F0AC|nr:LON peptidase N-terminal domain and RING finger protein 2 isoform X2 [Rhineura floridana]